MIKIILYKLYYISCPGRSASHQRCLYMIILIALNDNDDDYHHHLCCLLHFSPFSRSGTQSVKMCKEHGEPFLPPTQWRKRMPCVHVLVSWSKVDSSESAIQSDPLLLSPLIVVQWISYDWLRKLAPLSQPVRSKPKPIVCFPALYAGYIGVSINL